MSLLKNISSGRIGRAQKVVIYAPEGFGKSTLASQFPNPLFFDVEDSTSQLDVRRLGRADLPNLRAFESALGEVVTARPCATLVVDTVDWLEQMAVEAIIADAKSDKIQGIEDFGYGKGYTILKEKVTFVLAKLDAVIASGIHVVLLAHSRIVKFEPPDGAGAYDRYELKLTKTVGPLIKEWSDMLPFGNWRTQIAEKGRGENTKYKGIGGRDRQLYCNRIASWDAKNRHGLGDVEKWEIETIAKAFRAVGAPWGTVAPVPSPKPPAPEQIAAEKEPIPPPAVVSDEIPGLPPTGESDPELKTIIGEHEDAVNAFLLESKRIAVGETYRNLQPAYRTRILKNPAGFLRVALNGKGAVA